MTTLSRANVAFQELPEGTVTFLFTDIQGSTQLLHQLRDQYATLLEEHHQIIRSAVERWHGREVDTQGDAFFVAFPKATEAIAAAAEIQQTLKKHTWPEDVQVQVRMGLHTGEPWLAGEGYVGMDVHRAARIAHVGHGGQVLLSETTAALVMDELPDGVALLDLGRHLLKDMHRPEHIRQLDIAGLPAKFPPLTSQAIVPAASERPVRVVGDCPYRGLAAFREADAPFYYGRETFVDTLEKAICTQPFVAVIVGSSGSGKSSALFAGLLPRLRQEDGWRVASLRPGAQPFYELAWTLFPFLVDKLDETDRLAGSRKLARYLNEGEISLVQIMERVLKKDETARQTLLVVDQFEELYTQGSDEALQQRFIDQLLTLAGPGLARRRPPGVLLLTMRADFMGQALAYRPLADALQDASLLMGPMNRTELRSVVEKPAEKQGAAFEPGLVERLLDDVGDRPGNLPLLEFTLTQLWDAQTDGWLTHEDYEELGGVEGALASYADHVYDQLTDDEQEGARRALVQLVRPGEGTEDTRRVAAREELGDEGWSLLQGLAGQRLVVTGRDVQGRETAEVVHEALIQRWGRFREWMENDRSFRAWQEQLRGNLRQWQESKQDEGALLSGAPLALARLWLADRNEELSQGEIDYILAGSARERERQAARERRRRRAIMALAGGLVVALILVLVSLSQWRRAEGEVDARATAQWEAETAQEEAEAAEYTALLQASIGLASQVELDLRVGYPHRGVLLALEALEKFPYTPQAEQALARAVLESRARLILQHDDFINTVSWSPSGDRLLTASDDQTAVIWDGHTGERLLTLTGHHDWIVRATWSPDGQRVATAGADGIAIIWDAGSGQRLLTLEHEAEVYTAAWSRDGSRLATSSEDGTARVWDASTGEELLRLVHDGGIYHVSWSPDGKMLATISNDGTSGIWEAATGRQLQTLCCHDLASWMTAWSPDGRHLATSDQAGLVQVWDVNTGQEMVSLIIGAQESYIEWSPAGERLAAGDWTGEAAVYDVTTIIDPRASGPDDGLSPGERGDRLPKVTLEASTSNGGGVAWSPDGSLIASSTGQEVKVYDPATGEVLLSMRGHSGGFHLWGGLAWSRDGHRLASVDQQGTGIVWDITPNHREFLGHEGIIRTAAWSPDETRIASAGLDGTVKIWDAASGTLELDLDQGYLVSDVAWSPDGHRLAATVFIDCLTHIWDAVTGEELYVLPHGCIAVSWSPDGELLATANDPAPDSYDGTVKIWQAATGQELHSFTVHAPDKIIWDLEWSPDGRQMVSTASGEIEGGSVVVWDPETGEIITDLGPYGDWGTMVTWLPDGEHVAIFPPGILVDAATGEIVVQYEGEGYGPSSAWSPDGSRLAVSSANGVLVLDTWSGELVSIYHQGQPMQGGDWSHDSKWLLIGNNSSAQTVEIWPVWQSLEELMAYAEECCVVGQLSPADRQLFGLDGNEE